MTKTFGSLYGARSAWRLRALFITLGVAVALLTLLVTPLYTAASNTAVLARSVDSSVSPSAILTDTITHTQAFTAHLPIVTTPPLPFPPPLPPPLVFTGTEPIDFTAVYSDLQTQGLELAFNKIGFHHGVGGIAGDDPEFVQMITDLDAAGTPFFLKSTDNAQPIYIAQELMRSSGISHTLVFRRASGPNGDYNVPNYDLSPADAALAHWQLHMDGFPPELDPSLIWIETINEVDKTRSEWLAEFALETAQLAIANGYRWAAFGWSSGEPEPEDWESPAMLEFLQFAGEHPDQVAIALHEYSLNNDLVSLWYPYLLGRFQLLFQVCDEHNIPRPTVLITEWGWTYSSMPPVEEAMQDIIWASWLYAAYPQVKGAAVWYLGGEFGGIAEQTRLLISPIRDYSLTHYFGYTPGIGAIDTTLFTPNPPTRYPWEK
ncbi:MAG: hypothetical protein H6662_18280 [Ardenticatenaceae bacterium]|nr:hypothetical protein [Anaerolineales bacterium]MCB8923539.1 hypothetical protein [Ardenticatenaceae bacterium]MCB8991890.1 hypothetical protein [Ardenticatenaceae bacterium]MCB9003736.1 hypothetical protein [Ardenticatenaceae bacterium]